MRVIGIKALNSRLSEHLRFASSGETILVTNRNRVVAEIGPPRGTGGTFTDDPGLVEMIRRGELTPPRITWRGEPPCGPPVMKLDELLRALDDQPAS